MGRGRSFAHRIRHEGQSVPNTLHSAVILEISREESIQWAAYAARLAGLEKELAMKVAEQLSTRDRLSVHMRDDLGID